MAKASSVPEASLAQYEKLIATQPDVDRKGASMPYTSLNGHMFSFLTSDGTLALRLAEDDREAFLKRFKTTLVEQHGRVMKEYVEVPASLLSKTKQLAKYFAQSVDYVASLKPKPTKRKPAKKKAKATPTRKAKSAKKPVATKKAKTTTKKSKSARKTASTKKP